MPQVRTDAYQAALEGNPALLKGASVLDVGCGTAILSMFAARGGAAAVVGECAQRAAGWRGMKGRGTGVAGVGTFGAGDDGKMQEEGRPREEPAAAS